MDMSNFKSTLFGFFIAAIVFCGLYFLLRFNNWNMRHSRVLQSGIVSTGLNVRSFVEFCILAMSSWVYFFFPFQLLICWYFFVFFKLQSVPSIMLPPMDLVYTTASPYFIFVANLHVMVSREHINACFAFHTSTTNNKNFYFLRLILFHIFLLHSLGLFPLRVRSGIDL